MHLSWGWGSVCASAPPSVCRAPRARDKEAQGCIKTLWASQHVGATWVDARLPKSVFTIQGLGERRRLAWEEAWAGFGPSQPKLCQHLKFSPLLSM